MPNSEVVFEEDKVDLDKPVDLTKTENVDIRFIRIFGGSGKGKTLFGTGECFAAVETFKCSLIITNVKLLKVPPGVEVFYSADVRAIMARMEATPGISSVLFFDELDKSVNSRASKSNFNLWVVRICGDARKSGVKAFIYTAQPRKGVDSLIRANDSYVLLPRHMLDINNCPMAWLWDDPEAFEVDFQRGEDNYREAIPISSNYDLEFLRDAYSTKQKIPLALDPTVLESEVGELTDEFIEWCEKMQIVLDGAKATHVKSYLVRWNSAVFMIPYSRKGLEVLFTELLRRKIVGVK